MNLTNLWKSFRNGTEPPKEYGENRDWNVDLIPKFVMANGNLVKLLLKTNVSQYLEWKCVDGTFVYQWEKPLFGKAKGVIHKVPATAKEAFSSDLIDYLKRTDVESSSLLSKILISKILKLIKDMIQKPHSRT